MFAAAMSSLRPALVPRAALLAGRPAAVRAFSVAASPQKFGIYRYDPDTMA
eukprot:CAMPEP_0180469482 /NCGR_PEP_ID=MMETSP1036_2-20121128/28079_1 /TAXON_ID=632150 /ORGANISM="Azadinium spinosum, Strain 3D9" /LENGTH=50 /DNA_ID=CAMNT_0022476559 /DNA_START=72 /DNA_END=221 /DNA_ORIENTATION=+